MTDGEGPGEVAPEVGLLLGVADDLGHLVAELAGHGGDCIVKLLARDDLVDEAPFEGGLGADGFVEPEHLAGTAVADDDGEPLSGPAGGHGAAGGANLADRDVVGGYGEVASNVELVATADDHAVEASDGGLADVAEAVMGLD